MGKTETFIKKDFIASLTYDVKFDTVFLYTSFDQESIVNSVEVELLQDEYMLMGYNEKLLLPTTELGYPPNASRIMATLLGTAVWASSLPSNSMET